MSETSSSAQRSAGAAGIAKHERRLLTLAAWGIVFALALAVVSLRFLRLNEIPAGVAFDEGTDGTAALRVLRGEHAVFFPELGGGRETLGFYAMALSIFFLGRTPLAIHLPSALVSSSTVFVVFWLGRLLFGRDESGRSTPWRGLLLGGAGAGLLAVSVGQTIIARTSFRGNYVPLFLCLCLALLWWGWPRAERKRVSHGGAWWRIALAGACAGLMLYTYIAARFAPLLLLLFGLSVLLPYLAVVRQNDGAAFRLSGFGAALNRVRTELPWIGTFVGVAALAAAPLFIYFALNPDYFVLRSNSLLVFSAGSESWRSTSSLPDQRVGASFSPWFARGPKLAAQLRRQANAESIGSVLFLAWRGDGRVALATVARLSPAASLDGRDVPTGHAGPRFRRP